MRLTMGLKSRGGFLRAVMVRAYSSSDAFDEWVKKGGGVGISKNMRFMYFKNTQIAYFHIMPVDLHEGAFVKP